MFGFRCYSEKIVPPIFLLLLALRCGKVWILLPVVYYLFYV